MIKSLLSQLPSPPPGKTGWPWTEETDPSTYETSNWQRVSIVTPSFNQGQFIEETIRSILLQNYPDLEYIIMDGGSTDETVSIIKKYEKWIKYWVSEKDQGQSNAINKGIEKCTAKIFNWINSDDILLKESLKTIIPHFDDLEVGCVAGRCSFINDKHTIITPQHLLTGRTYRILCGTANTYQPASFFRLEILQNNLGKLNENLHYGMDIELYATIGLTSKICWIENIISLAKLHKNAKTFEFTQKFANDCSKVFSKTLRSLPNSAAAIAEMKKLGLYIEGEDTYINHKKLSTEHIMMSFNYFLLSQLVFLKNSDDNISANLIFSYLKKEQLSFYVKQKLATSHWLNKKYFSLLKKIHRFIKN